MFLQSIYNHSINNSIRTKYNSTMNKHLKFNSCWMIQRVWMVLKNKIPCQDLSKKPVKALNHLRVLNLLKYSLCRKALRLIHRIITQIHLSDLVPPLPLVMQVCISAWDLNKCLKMVQLTKLITAIIHISTWTWMPWSKTKFITRVSTQREQSIETLLILKTGVITAKKGGKTLSITMPPRVHRATVPSLISTISNRNQHKRMQPYYSQTSESPTRMLTMAATL